MLLHIAVHTKIRLYVNETVSPFPVIFLLPRPCLCPLLMYVVTSWACVPCMKSEQLPKDGQVGKTCCNFRDFNIILN
jgi:hypothetical protein